MPFRHQGEKTSGQHGAPMGRGYAFRMILDSAGVHEIGDRTAKQAKQLGRVVSRNARKLSATTTDPATGKTQWGSRLREGVGGVGLLRPHHKTDLYSGMVRQEKTYESATQNQYTTFRRVSTNSDTRAWIHPGIEARHLFTEVAPYAGQVAQFLVGKIVSGGG